MTTNRTITMHSAIRNRVVAVITEQLTHGDAVPAAIEPGHHLVNDLGADSLDQVELVMAIEDEFELTISDDEAQRVETVGGLIELVAAKFASDS